MYHNFSSDDLTSSADGGSSANIVKQINDINQSLTDLQNRKVDIERAIAKYQPYIDSYPWTHGSCNSKEYPWVDGKCYDKANIQAMQRSLQSNVTTLKSELDGIPTKINDLTKRLDALQKSLPDVAQSDPDVINALASARISEQRATSALKGRNIIIWSVAGLVLLLGVGFVVAKFRKK